MANPSVRNGHIDIANELAERFATLPLKGEDWRVLWAVLRQTWGWKAGDRKKDADAISLATFSRMTGMKRPNVVRVLRRLVAQRLLLKDENVYGINQNHDQWVVAHRLPGSSAPATPLEVVAQELPKGVAHRLQKPVAHPLPSIDKEKDKKDRGRIDSVSDGELERRWKAAAIEHGWCDGPYADKTLAQARDLPRKDRDEFLRKVRVMLNSATHPRTRGFARKVYGEIAGLVNDRGPMRRVLTGSEQDERRKFAEGESGREYVREELGG